MSTYDKVMVVLCTLCAAILGLFTQWVYTSSANPISTMMVWLPTGVITLFCIGVLVGILGGEYHMRQIKAWHADPTNHMCWYCWDQRATTENGTCQSCDDIQMAVMEAAKKEENMYTCPGCGRSMPENEVCFDLCDECSMKKECHCGRIIPTGGVCRKCGTDCPKLDNDAADRAYDRYDDEREQVKFRNNDY